MRGVVSENGKQSTASKPAAPSLCSHIVTNRDSETALTIMAVETPLIMKAMTVSPLFPRPFSRKGRREFHESLARLSH